MIWPIVALLAIIQGITEFLPISSSGHLVIVQALFKQFGHPLPEDQTLLLDVALHVGTLLSVLVFFWGRIWESITRDRRVLWLVFVASIPAGVAGVTLKKHFEELFENPLGVGCLFFVTGAVLLWADRRPTGRTSCCDLSVWQALLIGLAQAVAILPGVSRSGSTIAAGIGVGLQRDEAAAFSFLMAIPVIAGAGLLEGLKRLSGPPDLALLSMLSFGALISFLVGVAALWWLIGWLQKGRLHWFAWWVFGLGAAVLVWQLCCGRA